MFWEKPLVEWKAITTNTINRDPEAGSVHSFTVNRDGSFVEINNRVPFFSEPDTLKWTELKIPGHARGLRSTASQFPWSIMNISTGRQQAGSYAFT